jgi:hypothetical protein
MYSRVRSGLRRHKGEKLKFLTLTSANESSDLKTHWEILRKRIKRLKPSRLMKNGWITKHQMAKLYKNYNRLFKFDYFVVRTAEGNGVLHVLFFGDYIPYDWIKENWVEIHGAWSVSISETKTGIYSPNSLTKYILTQYIQGQNAIEHYYFSKNWVFPGFCKTLKKNIKKYGYEKGIERINSSIDERANYRYTIQHPIIDEKKG